MQAEKLQQERAEAEADRAAQADELVALRARLATVADSEIKKLDDAIRFAEVRRDRAAARIVAIEAAMPGADAADARTARVADEARAAVTAAVPKALKLHAEIVRKVREYAALVAGADQQVDAANRLIGDGDRVQTVETAIRAKQARPRKVLSDRTFDRWCYESTGSELPDESQGKVRRSSDDPRRGRLEFLSGGHEIRSTPVVLRRRRYVEVLPADRPAGEPSLASRIAVPPLFIDGPAWLPPHHDEPSSILAALEAERSTDTRVAELEIADVSERDGEPLNESDGATDEAA